ncbi:MAG: hypothetical protein AABY11_00655 [archaeon]
MNNHNTLKQLAKESISVHLDWFTKSDFSSFIEFIPTDAAFIAAANPAAVLELIEEIERLNGLLKWDGVYAKTVARLLGVQYVSEGFSAKQIVDKIESLNVEIERLKEFEYMYKDLCK